MGTSPNGITNDGANPLLLVLNSTNPRNPIKIPIITPIIKEVSFFSLIKSFIDISIKLSFWNMFFMFSAFYDYWQPETWVH
ncbi:hypothetical protein, partial [Hymenobacter psychrophilus]|uniref:hypothetical protein n=1 Tax=Hymenobacter psychrophilus TaxID=651662 RepID=UPI001C31A899